jgi:hypothetical protein
MLGAPECVPAYGAHVAFYVLSSQQEKTAEVDLFILCSFITLQESQQSFR